MVTKKKEKEMKKKKEGEKRVPVQLPKKETLRIGFVVPLACLLIHLLIHRHERVDGRDTRCHQGVQNVGVILLLCQALNELSNDDKVRLKSTISTINTQC